MVAARVSMKMVMNTIQIAAWGTERPVSGLNLPQINNNCKGFRMIRSDYQPPNASVLSTR